MSFEIRQCAMPRQKNALSPLSYYGQRWVKLICRGEAPPPVDTTMANVAAAHPPVCCRALRVPTTDYSFEDCQLAMAEGQLRLPVGTCLLEFAKLVRRLGYVHTHTHTPTRMHAHTHTHTH